MSPGRTGVLRRLSWASGLIGEGGEASWSRTATGAPVPGGPSAPSRAMRPVLRRGCLTTSGVSWSVALDGGNRVTALTLPDNTLAYGYGTHGKAVSVVETASGSATTRSYGYDGQGRLTGVSDGERGVTVTHAPGHVRIAEDGTCAQWWGIRLRRASGNSPMREPWCPWPSRFSPTAVRVGSRSHPIRCSSRWSTCRRTAACPGTASSADLANTAAVVSCRTGFGCRHRLGIACLHPPALSRRIRFECISV